MSAAASSANSGTGQPQWYAQRRPHGSSGTGQPSPQALDGIRVLELGVLVASPLVGSILADFGADVIKIEEPRVGDPMRWLYPKNGTGLFFKIEGRNKRCVTLDLRKPRGQEILRDLVKVSDVLVENFTPGVMEKWGLGWEELHRLNPRLVMCRVSGWGQDGPYSDRKAYGRVAEAFSGFAWLNGDPNGPPMHSAMSLGDTAASVWAVIGVLMALYHRDVLGGEGQCIDLGLWEGLFRQIEQHIIVFDQLGRNLMRQGQRNPGVPYVGSFETKDGRYFSFSQVTPKTIAGFLKALGIDQDTRFNTFRAAQENIDELYEYLTSWIGSRTLEEVWTAFCAHGAAGGPVMSAKELCADPHVQAREMIVTLDDPELGRVSMQGIVPKLSHTPGTVRHAGLPMGASNEEVFCGLLGMGRRRCRSWRRRVSLPSPLGQRLMSGEAAKRARVCRRGLRPLRQ